MGVFSHADSSVVLALGAPSYLIDRCVSIFEEDEESKPETILNAEVKKVLSDTRSKFVDDGYSVYGLARCYVDEAPATGDALDAMCLLGFVAFKQQPHLRLEEALRNLIPEGEEKPVASVIMGSHIQDVHDIGFCMGPALKNLSWDHHVCTAAELMDARDLLIKNQLVLCQLRDGVGKPRCEVSPLLQELKQQHRVVYYGSVEEPMTLSLGVAAKSASKKVKSAAAAVETEESEGFTSVTKALVFAHQAVLNPGGGKKCIMM